MAKRDSHCSWCGAAHVIETWPRACSGCGNMTYKNPLPVAVVVLPIDDGVLLIRRGISAPAAPAGSPSSDVRASGALAEGKLALPGGFVDHDESWQEAAARELREETRIVVEPSQLVLRDVRTSPDGHLLLFCEAPRMSGADLPTFLPNVETMDRVVTREPIELAFPLHTEALRAHFARR